MKKNKGGRPNIVATLKVTKKVFSQIEDNLGTGRMVHLGSADKGLNNLAIPLLPFSKNKILLLVCGDD